MSVALVPFCGNKCISVHRFIHSGTCIWEYSFMMFCINIRFSVKRFGRCTYISGVGIHIRLVVFWNVALCGLVRIN
jgi:hypothetical protein